MTQTLITPSLLDFIVYFECEPEWLHPMGWFYGARFTIIRGEDRIITTIAPDEQELDLQWFHSGIQRLNLKLVAIHLWTLDMQPAREVLRVISRSSETTVCEIQLKPIIHVDFNMGW